MLEWLIKRVAKYSLEEEHAKMSAIDKRINSFEKSCPEMMMEMKIRDWQSKIGQTIRAVDEENRQMTEQFNQLVDGYIKQRDKIISLQGKIIELQENLEGSDQDG